MSVSDLVRSYVQVRNTVEFFSECMALNVTKVNMYKTGYREHSDIASRLGELEAQGKNMTESCRPRDIVLGALAYILMNPLKTKRAMEYNHEHFGLKYKMTVTRRR